MNIFIIGATSGIGNSLWRHYTSEGYNVAVFGRREELLQEMKSTCPEHTHTECCDLSVAIQLEAAIASARLRLHAIDIAIVCAGTGELNPNLENAVEQTTIATNIAGWTHVMTTLYHIFEQQGYGHLVTVTSVGGLQPTPGAPSYSASKAYQINYTKSLRRKAKGSGIVITEIRPGLVGTRMAKGEGLFWVMPLSKVTRQITKAISRKSECAIITKRWRIINFLLRHFA